MDPQTKEFIEKHIDKIAKEFRYCNRKLKNSDECVCYKQDKPCHDLSGNELNCFFCYCPEYKTDVEEGVCKINSVYGKWLINEKFPAGKIWDCSDCEISHKEEVVKRYLRKFFGICG